MRAYVICIDRIYEVDGKVDDSDEFLVISDPPNSGLRGALISPTRWATIKDTAFLFLEHELKINVRRWQEIADSLKSDMTRYVDHNYALEQVKIFNDLLPRARLMDPSLITRKSQ